MIDYLFQTANLIITSIACLSGAVVTLISMYLTNRYSRRIAIDSGALSKPEMSIYLFENKLGEKQENSNIILIHPASTAVEEETAIAYYPLSFRIENDGDATCENSILAINVPSACYHKEQAEAHSLNIKVSPGVFKESVVRDVNYFENFTTISYKIPSVSPKSSAVVTESFFFVPTFLRSIALTALTKDGVPFTTNWFYSVACNFTITLLVKDKPPIIGYYQIGALRAKSLDDGVRLFVERTSSDATQYFNSLSLWTRIKYRFRKPHKKYFVFVEYEIAERIDNDNIIYFMKSSKSFPKGRQLIVNERAKLESKEK